jgi:alkylation response protein AidB-like acyl-CoA dehydrogenase
MPGYSGTPLPQKLGIKPGFKVALPDVAPEVKAELKSALDKCEDSERARGALDLVLLPVQRHADLKKKFPQWSKRLTPAGMLWVSWPKKSSGVATDLDENKVRAVGLAAGLVDVKVCAVNEVWSGLKFVRRVKDRG